MGTPETDRNIANKISRGGFTAGFFLQCLSAIGTQTLRVEDLNPRQGPAGCALSA